MHFIEKLFDMSPDGGNGSLETLYVVAFLVVLSAILYLSHARIRQLIHRHR